VVAQSPEPGAYDKNARLFTITLLLTITLFAKINPKNTTIYNNTLLLTITIFARMKSELKYKIFLRATSPNIKNLS